MNIYPFYKVAEQATLQVLLGNTVHQQFLCSNCGVKQTMAEENKWFTQGVCEECGHTTDIEAAGCNYMMISSRTK
jgi:hypothetical protein